MRALILGGGYGTRLERDLRNDASGAFQHLIGVPKPLMPIGEKPLISHWMESLKNVDKSNQIEIYVVTNGVNHNMFKKWSENWEGVKLVCDESNSNENRSGAVACMALGAKEFDFGDAMLVIAGDTLFYEDFNLKDIIFKFEEFQLKDPDASLLVYVNCTDEDVPKYGILETDSEQRVINFLEKPSVEETSSRKECPCFYILSKKGLSLLNSFLDSKKDEPLKSRDATGNFIKYLYPNVPVYAVQISGRFDVGGLQTYLQCHKHFSK